MKFLIVSGNEEERKLIRDYLKMLPFQDFEKSHHLEIIEDTTCEAALQRVVADYQAMSFYDFIIADQNMEGMTGVQLANELADKQLSLTSPVVVFCEDIKRDVSKEKRKTGVTAFFELPIRYKKIMDLLVKVSAILIVKEEKERKEKIDSLMSIKGTLDFLSSLENIYIQSAIDVNSYRMYAPWSALPYLSLGRIHIGSNKFADAIPYLKTAIAINFKNKEAHRSLLLCYQKTGKFFQERSELEVMLRASPRSSNVLLKVGDASLREGDYESAMEYFKRAIVNHRKGDSNRLKAKSHVGLGKAYVKEGDHKKDPSIYVIAKDEFDKAVSIDPLLLAAYTNLAVVYNKLGKFDEAKKTIAKAVKTMPADAEGWFSLFEIYLIDGDVEKARHSLAKALKFDPENQVLLITAGEVYMRQGMLEDAIEIFERTVEINPSYSLLFNYLGICYRRLNKIETAVNNYKKAVEIDPDDYNVHFNLGKAYHAGNHLDLAKQSYQTALDLEPGLKEAGQNIALLETYAGTEKKLKSARR